MEAGSQDASAVVAPASAQGTILIVDDEEDIRTALHQVLSAYLPTLNVVAAADGPQALAALGQHDVNVIVSDYKMRPMDGVDFLLRSRELAPDAARVLMTAFPDVEVASRAINVGGIDYFLHKPVTAKVAVDVVRACLSKTRRFRPLEVNNGRTAPTRPTADVRARIGELAAQIARLKVQFGLGEISSSTFHRLLQDLEDERGMLESAMLQQYDAA